MNAKTKARAYWLAWQILYGAAVLLAWLAEKVGGAFLWARRKALDWKAVAAERVSGWDTTLAILEATRPGDDPPEGNSNG
jgi:hypothetical protein